MNAQDQLTANALWSALVNVDLQLYKGSIYKLRWGSPGGIDHALPAYREAQRTLEHVEWPPDLENQARELANKIGTYMRTLEEQDVTSASGQHSRMIGVFEDLRERVRHWPRPLPAEDRSPEEYQPEPGLPGHVHFYAGEEEESDA